jgi:ribonuclease D
MISPAGDARVTLARDPAELGRIVERCLRASRVALDVEANGLFAYRASLCVLQLAWEEEGGLAIAVVDTLATAVDPLRPVLGPEGPIKVLHDLSFDARLLDEVGAPLARVRDTSVAARLLGATATGLSAIVAAELGVTLDKRLQQHDWSRRPLLAEHLLYLAEDVRHLLALDDRLARRAEAREVTDEIAEECGYKLASARWPPRDARPAYVRVKGAAGLDPVGRAVLRRLVEAREAAAEAADVPPFKVVGNEVLLELAHRRPATLAALSATRGAVTGRAAQHTGELLRAIAEGVRDGAVPPDHAAFFQPPARAPSRAELAARRAIEARISAFRKAEAKRRGVDEQAVLPGHCAHDLADILAAHAPADPALADAIARIPGIGAFRIARYGEAFQALAQPAAPNAPLPPS